MASAPPLASAARVGSSRPAPRASDRVASSSGLIGWAAGARHKVSSAAASAWRGRGGDIGAPFGSGPGRTRSRARLRCRQLGPRTEGRRGALRHGGWPGPRLSPHNGPHARDDLHPGGAPPAPSALAQASRLTAPPPRPPPRAPPAPPARRADPPPPPPENPPTAAALRMPWTPAPG